MNVLRREVEEHFERSIHAIEVRRHTLLTQSDEILQQGIIPFSPLPVPFLSSFSSSLTLFVIFRAAHIRHASEDTNRRLHRDLSWERGQLYTNSWELWKVQNSSLTFLLLPPPSSSFLLLLPSSFFLSNIILVLCRRHMLLNYQVLIQSKCCLNLNDECFYICDEGNHSSRRIAMQGLLLFSLLLPALLIIVAQVSWVHAWIHHNYGSQAICKITASGITLSSFFFLMKLTPLL